MEKLKIIAVTQARIGSSRLPQKVLKKICGVSMLAMHIRRLKKAHLINNIIVATADEKNNEKIIQIAEEENVLHFVGSAEDVLDRFYMAVKDLNPDYVVRLTSDCPLIDPYLVDQVIKMTVDNELDYGANTLVQDFPDGQDLSVIKFGALEQAWKEAKLLSDREHVTPYIRKNSSFFDKNNAFKAMNFKSPHKLNHVRMTVDEKEDLDAIKVLVNALGMEASWIEYTEYILNHPNEFSNQNIVRNEGYIKSLNQEE